MDTNAWYEFTDQNGERHVSRGDNGYIQQSVNQGIPIYVNDKGEWFTEPYLELTPEGYVSHIPAWFKDTDEYTRWNSEFVPQMANTSATKEVWEGYRDTLKSLGAQGALRMETYNAAEKAGITDPEEKKRAYDDYLSIILEGAGQGNAKLDVLQEAGTEASVADIARVYKNLSKEDLSEQMTGLLNIINAKGKGKWDQKTTREALTLYRLLNMVADNPESFGKDKEFEGILEASEWQKFQAHVNSDLQTMAEGMPLFTWIARGVAAGGKAATGKGPGFRIEDYRENGLYNKYTGQNLRGIEGSIVSGNVLGSIENIGATIAESMIFGKFLDTKIAAGAPGGILSKIGTFSKTFGGSMVYDWFAHDLPIDLSLFATDRAGGLSAEEAWYDESRTQPLFGLFGPEVPYGLAMNLAGDALMDLAIPVLGITSGAIWDSLDDVSGGALNKIRENVAVKNLKVQQWISDTPVLGTGLRKFSDWLFGSENTALIREARKASILEGSMSFYADAQNLLTLKNHYGAEVVAPMYKHLVDELGINEQIEKFVKNANKYGGFGEVKVEWDTAKAGVGKHYTEMVTDDIPREVKQGLLDYQRLEELKGEVANEGGIISNPKREAEIAKLEKSVENLSPEIKKFAEDVSNLNKRVEQMMVGLGLSTQDWIDALNADPRWKNYMTRQVMVPGGIKRAGALDPATNKLLTGTRTGFYKAEQTLSPIMSLDMKVHALGNAYAWNERAKALVGFELTQGKIKAGAESIDLANKIKEVRATIAVQEATAAKLGYDSVVSGLSDRMVNVGATIRKLNEELGSLENITIKSAFTGMGMGPDQAIKGFKADFESGKYVFADDVLANNDLTPAQGATIIQNTYYLGKGESGTELENVNIGRGISESGVPFEFELDEKGIVKMTEITSEEGLADSVSGMNLGRSISIEDVRAIGKENVAALNRMQMFYRDNNLELPGSYTAFHSYFCDTKRDGNTYGFSPYIPHLKVEDGKVVCTSGIYLNTKYFGADKVEEFKGHLKKDVQTGWHPKGTEDPSSVFDHEVAHDLTKKLAIAEFNQQIKDLGISPEKVEEMAKTLTYAREQKTPATPERFLNELEKTIGNNRVVIEGEILHEAMRRIGINDTARNRNDVISKYTRYARTRKSTQSKVAETIAESIADYAANGTNANELSRAIVEVISERLKKFQAVASPFETMKASGLDIPNGLFISTVGGDRVYKFPEIIKADVKTEIIISKPLLNQDTPQPFSQKMWHGSGKPKSEIYVGAQVPILGGGKYWAFDWTAAADFGDNIESSVISLKNPLIIRTDEEWRGLTKEAGWRFPNPIGLDEDIMKKYSDDMRNLITSSGYDGVIVYTKDSKDGLLRAVFGKDQVVDYGVEVRTRTITQGGEDPGVARAKWLDEWRQKNPYLKGELTDETFQKANLWDSFFQKEIRAYDSGSKSTAPEALIKKSGDYVEKRRAALAKKLVDEVKKLSIDGFDSDLAMMVIGRNSKDIAEAMDNFVIRQVEMEAENLAKKMDGGATRDNINTALITLWSDTKVQESVVSMLNDFIPGGSIDVQSKVANLFDTQAKGLAAYEALPLDAKVLLDEKEKLLAQLRKENKGTIKTAKALDKHSSYIDGGTHLIHYREGGEDVYVAVNDPVVASMLQRPYDYKETNMISETTASIANFVATTYRLGTTGANPLALVRNILRDPIQAMVTGGFNPLSMTLSPEVFFKTLRQYGLDDDTIATVTQRIRAWAQSGTMTQEMRLGPGKYSSTYNSEVDKINKKLRNISNGKVITFFQTPLESWEGFFRNQIGQQSFVKNFKRTGDVNKALGAALMDTSNVTTNFSHSIGKFKRATATIPYLSSAVNGTVSFWRLFNMDPIGMVTRITAGFMVPVMAITMWNLSSEENRKVYESLPEWYKQSHLIMVDPQGNVIAFPLPEEIQQFSGTARKLMEYTQDATPFALPTIAAQGALGFLPFEIDGYFDDDGSINIGRGTGQLLSGIMPQAFTTIYELAAQEDLFTGQDLSNMQWWNQLINAGTNMFGTGFKNLVNSIGIMCGASEDDLIGLSFQNNLARDLFGMGFNEAKNQFTALVGNPTKINEDGSERKATGLFAKNEELQRKIKALDGKIAVASDDEKPGLEKQKQELVENFTTEVTNLMDNYQRLFQVTGGLEQWQKARLVQVLTLGGAYSSADSKSYQAASSDQAYLDERGLAIQRYVNAGLPSGPTMENLDGTDSFDIQAAVNRFYGVNKQATQDFKNAVELSGMKDVKDEFYAVMQKIYDSAEEQGKQPDYDLIERIQARYLQMVDATLVPIINQYGINVLNNNDFIDAVRRHVNGMIPSDDWRQSARNAKKFLSTKDFPTATVDVKKWLKNRYGSGLRNRGLDSDPEVTERIESIKNDIDAGRTGAAAGKIQDLKTGVQKANFYISEKDLQTLNELYNMVK